MQGNPGDVEQRLRRLEDRAEIADLIAAYGLGVDDKDLDVIARSFTGDAVFEPGGGRAQPVSGRDAILAYYRESFERSGASFHYPHTRLLDFEDDDEATGIVTSHVESAKEGATFVMGLRYYDRYRREAGRWRIARRTLRFLYAMPLAELD